MAKITDEFGINANNEQVVEQKGIDSTINNVQDNGGVEQVVQETEELNNNGLVSDVFDDINKKIDNRNKELDIIEYGNKMDVLNNFGSKEYIESMGGKATLDDYENLYRTHGPSNNYPELRSGFFEVFEPWDKNNQDYLNAIEDKTLNDKNLEFINTAPNHKVALKRYGRIKEGQKSEELTGKDPVSTQIANSLLAGIWSYDTFAPALRVFKNIKNTNKTMSNLQSLGDNVLTANVWGAYNEASRGANGLETNYLSTMVGATGFTLVLDQLGKAAFGRLGPKIAKSLTEPKMENPAKEIGMEWDPDANMLIKLDDNGNEVFIKPEDAGMVKVKDEQDNEMYITKEDSAKYAVDGIIGEKQRASIGTKLGIASELLVSDVHVLAQSESELMRGIQQRSARRGTTTFDKNGNPIIEQETAYNVMQMSDGRLSLFEEELGNEFYKYKKETGIKIKEDEFTNNVDTEWQRITSQQELDAYAHMYKVLDDENEISELRKWFAKEQKKSEEKLNFQEEIEYKILNDYYNNNPINIDPNSPYKNALEKIQKFYNSNLDEAQYLGLKGFKNINKNKGYSTVRWDTFKFRDMNRDDAIELLTEGSRRHPANRNNFIDGEPTDEFKKSIEDFYDDISGKAERSVFRTDFAKLTELGNNSHEKKRTFKMDYNYVKDLLVDDASTKYKMYNSAMRGRLAIKKLIGEDSMADLKKKIDSDKKSTKAEKQAAERLIMDIAGEFKKPGKDDRYFGAVSNLKTYTSMTMNGDFGLYQIGELAAASTYQAFQGQLSSRLGKSIMNSIKQTILNLPVDELDEISKVSRLTNAITDSRKNNRANIYTEEVEDFTTNWLKKTFGHLSNFSNIINILKPAAYVMEDFNSANIMKNLMDNNYTKNELARAGLSELDGKKLSEMLKKVIDFDNNKFDLKSLPTEWQRKFIVASQNMMEDIAVKGDSIHVPPAVKSNKSLNKIMFMFYKFPLTFSNTFVKRGIEEEPIKLAAASASMMMVYLLQRYAVEQAEISAGLKEDVDAKYDFINDPDALQNELPKAFAFSGAFSVPGMMYDTFANITGRENISGYRARGSLAETAGGPIFSTAQTAIEAANAVVDDGTWSESARKAEIKLLPMRNNFLIEQFLNNVSEEYFREQRWKIRQGD